MTHLTATMSQVVEKLTSLANLANFSEIQAFSDQLTNTSYFLYHARAGIEIDIDNYKSFLESWVYIDGHCREFPIKR